MEILISGQLIYQIKVFKIIYEELKLKQKFKVQMKLLAEYLKKEN